MNHHTDTGFKVTAGSLALADILSKIFTARKIKAGTPQIIDIHFSAFVGDHLEAADKEKIFGRAIFEENARLHLSLCPSEHPDTPIVHAHVEFPNGEEVEGFRVAHAIPIHELQSCVRLDDQIALNLLPKRLRRSAAAGGALAAASLLTDTIPVVAEISMIVGFSASLLAQRRIAFLATDGDTVFFGNIPEIGWWLIDEVLTNPAWQNRGDTDHD